MTPIIAYLAAKYDKMMCFDKLLEEMKGGLEIHTQLSPILFERYRIKQEKAKKLLALAESIIAESDRKITVDDIVLCGSLCDFTYTDKSDVDLHIIYDDEGEDDPELFSLYLDEKRKLYNLEHTILLNGHPIEIYFQDKKEQHESRGIYSLKNDKWVKIPKPLKNDMNLAYIEQIALKIKGEVVSLFEDARSVNGDALQKVGKRVDHIFKKIVNERKDGLQEDGVLSHENLLFKALRQNDTLEMMKKITTYTKDQKFSDPYPLSEGNRVPTLSIKNSGYKTANNDRGTINSRRWGETINKSKKITTDSSKKHTSEDPLKKRAKTTGKVQPMNLAGATAYAKRYGFNLPEIGKTKGLSNGGLFLRNVNGSLFQLINRN